MQVVNKLVVACKYYDDEYGECENQGRWMVAWLPAISEDEALVEDISDAKIASGIVDGDVSHQINIVCDQHLDDEIDSIGSRFWPEEANLDDVYVAELISMKRMRRSKVELFVMDPDVEVTEVAKDADMSEETDDDGAPYGRKADGTPRQRPGRKALSNKE